MTVNETDGVPTPGPAVGLPRLAPGARLLGRYEASGLREERFLVRRADGQVVLLSPALYQIAAAANGQQDLSALARRVGAIRGSTVTEHDVEYLVRTKLTPLGLVVCGDEPIDERKRADPLLSLAWRRVFLPAPTVRRLAALLAPLFSIGVVVSALLALASFEAWLWFDHGVTSDLVKVMVRPAFLLAVFALLLLSTLIHELGHAAGCHYSGARPGAVGVGIYLLFPAFYTNVTDGYRLDRRGRLATDLGGVYFNGLFVLAAGALYLATGWPVLVVAIMLTNIEMIQQMLPFVRLDGYYILGDLVGVPDLFGRVWPILVSLAPGHRHDPRVADLRPRVRAIVTAWVVVVVPALMASGVLLAIRMPALVRSAGRSLRANWAAAGSALRTWDLGRLALALVAVLFVGVPLVGLSTLAGRFALQTFRLIVIRLRRQSRAAASSFEPAITRTRHDPEEATMQHPAPQQNSRARSAAESPTLPPTGPVAKPVAALTASSFTEELMLRARSRPPEGGWRRTVYRATGGWVRVGPSRAELQRRQLIARAKAPIRGSRRVVVLSRKGGAGKTTTTLMLGHTFATHRGDRVVALDANPDAGSLVHRVRRETSQTITSLLADRGKLDRYADVRAYTSQAPTRLEIIASDDDPRISQRLGEADYHDVISLLDRHYNLVLLDTGTGILDDAIQGILKEADQIVIVMPPALDGARVAAGTLDWLDRHGHAELVRGAVALINCELRRGLVELDAIESHFARRCSDVIRVPADPVLAAGAATGLEELRPSTRLAYLQLAAAVADGFRVSTPRP